MHSSKRERIEKASAGELVAVLAEGNIHGDTLGDEAHPIILEQMEFYEPVISEGIEAKPPPIKKSFLWLWPSSPTRTRR